MYSTTDQKSTKLIILFRLSRCCLQLLMSAHIVNKEYGMNVSMCLRELICPKSCQTALGFCFTTMHLLILHDVFSRNYAHILSRLPCLPD